MYRGARSEKMKTTLILHLHFHVWYLRLGVIRGALDIDIECAHMVSEEEHMVWAKTLVDYIHGGDIFKFKIPKKGDGMSNTTRIYDEIAEREHRFFSILEHFCIYSLVGICGGD